MVEEPESGGLAASLAELKAYLRIETEGEDAVLAGLLRSAAALCEQFTGQWLIQRVAQEKIAGGGGWQRLSARPVAMIEAVEAIDAQGVAHVLPLDAYAIDIDAAGDGWVRSTRAGDHRRLQVRYRAGLAAEMNGLPEALRQGIVRLAAEHFAARGGESAPPAVVRALWRPFRRMRLA
ncbi:head-tail connector protein [Sphingobium sp. HWE2-09]|uniref:head-tail connector protein n=1 Tax=Sphingobium sp. HWE2-09 TaxID=3108390 RepID=UPI002DCDCC02|nr:phage head-tail connector protein [Sphingobium sp. HWE2-09]